MVLEKLDKEIFRDHWYRQNYILFELIKLAQYKEVVFIDKSGERLPVRCMFPYTVDCLKEHFKVYRFFNSYAYNIYLSCAYFKHHPVFSYNPSERRKQMDKWSYGDEPQYKQCWNGYDLFFDFDSAKPDDIADAYTDAGKFKAILDHYQVPYYLGWSGSKGFHIRIYYKYLPQTLGLRIVDFCKLLAERIKEKVQLPTLDIGVFDERRVFKAPYSFDRGNICLPLDNNQFENFAVNEMKAEIVLNKIKIYHRGDLMRHTQFSHEQQRQHFLEFLKAVRT
jgi:hypothetical protein